MTGSDPFGPGTPDFDATHLLNNACDANPGCNTDDVVADATIVLSEVGGGLAFLLNVCSYPSGIPGSDPSDCVFAPNVGFLTIVKNATPNNGTPFTFNSSAAATTGDSTWTINGSGQQQLISFAPTTTLDLNEAVPSGWRLDSASCVQVTATPPPSTGTPTSTGVNDLEIQSGIVTRCTFNDTQLIRTLSITKTAAPSTYSAPGQVINYTIVATNTGNVAQSLTVSDPNVTNLVCTPANGTSVAPGASMTCTASHTITQADIDAGHYANTSCVNATGATQACDSEDVTAEKNPALSITKTAAPLTYSASGQVITYTYVVRNTGNTTQAGPFSVTDDKQGTIAPCGTGPLAPGASTSCTSTHTITQADIDAGSIHNVACLTGTQVCDDATVTAEKNPALSITKTAAPLTYSAPGQVITYTYVVRNTGNTTQAGPFSVTDDKQGTIAPCGTGPLAPGASTSCTSTHTITQADIDAGSIHNVACLTGTQVCDDATVTAEKNPALSITKTAAPLTYSASGQVITYTYVVRNTGNTT